MEEICTMNLSIQALEKWKQERKSLVPTARKSLTPLVRTKQEPQTELNQEPQAVSEEGTENIDDSTSQRSTDRLSELSGRNENSHSCISNLLTELNPQSPSNDSFTSARQTQASDDHEVIQPTENAREKSHSTIYSEILEMSSLGLKMCETEEMTRALHEKIQSSLNASPATGASALENSHIVENVKVITETKQLHREILARIASLAGDSQMKVMQSKIEEIEKKHLEDRKEIDCLKRQVDGLITRVKESQKQRPQSNGTKYRFISDSSSESEDDIWKISSDDEEPVRRTRPTKKSSKESASTSSASHSSTERPKLSGETEKFIDECNLKMKWHGLLHRNVVFWAESHVPPLQWHLKLIGSFLNKKLKEEECQELLVHFREFLDDVINNKQPPQPKRPRLEKSVVSYVESSDSDTSSSSSSSTEELENSSASESTSLLSEEGIQVIEPEEPSANADKLSTETEYFIDDCVAIMNRFGLSYKDLFAWWSRNSSTKLDLRTVSLFMHKRMKENECQPLIPLLKRFLEERSNITEIASKSNSLITTSSPKKPFGRRCIFSAEDRTLLEDAYKKKPFPTASERQAIAKNLKVSPEKVLNWFKSRRARDRQKEKKKRD